MGKARLAICMEDHPYQERFVNCLMHHYRERYEIHSFTKTEEIPKEEAFHLYILETQSMKTGLSEGENVIFLQEENSLTATEKESDKRLCLGKYQEVYRIMEKAEELVGKKNGYRSAEEAIRRLGVISLEYPGAQMVFSTMLASISGEKKKTLLLNLQPYSGMEYPEGSSLEDLMTCISGGGISRSRILSAIGHGPKWDYVYPVKNAEHLGEADGELYERIVSTLGKELEYQVEIINFGATFSGGVELLDSCHEIYMLEHKEQGALWRRRDFEREMERRGKGELLHRIHRISLPAILGSDKTWQEVAQKWEWSSPGDYVRKIQEMEKDCG